METVDVMIRIPKYVFEDTQRFQEAIAEYVRNGTVLPKGHYRLISTGDLDISKLVDSDMEWVMGICDISRVQNMIDNAPTIIEVDEDSE